MNEFQDLHVVVTGATGELGATVAEALLARGAICHLPVRSASKLAPSLARAHVVSSVDLSDETAVTAFYEGVPSLWASIHCAGAFAYTPLAAAVGSELERMWQVNARATYLCARAAALRMRSGGRGGRLVNVVARQALEPRRGAAMVPYAMSKAALVALTVALAEELVPDRIQVNAVAPSILDTPANRSNMPTADYSKWVSLADVSRSILFLASKECAASGTVMPIFGAA
jgi:NAD(P)-dependent dehydrogenase (short-subunit alcohol dehydrogenase family)